MGRPSQRWYSAQRPGKRERARVKKHHRGESFGSVPGAGTYVLKAGRKKWEEFHRSRSNPFGYGRSAKPHLAYGETEDHVNGTIAHPAGNRISKAGTQTPNGQAIR